MGWEGVTLCRLTLLGPVCVLGPVHPMGILQPSGNVCRPPVLVGELASLVVGLDICAALEIQLFW